MTATRPFRAFVSYCHADVKFAAWLQRKLEGYRLPRRLVDRVQPLEGQASGRIGPVFRDRADLSAAEDLSAAVKDAIAASSALIVVASPDAAASHWVAREIALFRESHANAPILVALARGEPDIALPHALRQDGIEPLAADFRKHGDGRRLALLKMVAGVAGIPLDALVQRDAQRQMRRVMAVTVGAATLALVMTGLLAVAMQARADAERQRVEAEGLVEYMLTDLREGLKGVGRLEIMTAVNERAMAYYADQGELSHLTDASLKRRARVLHAMGEDDGYRGAYDAGSAKFLEARRVTAEVLARHPRDADSIFAHAQSEYWLGFAASRRDDIAHARQRWSAYLHQAEALAQVEPRSRRSLTELGYAHGNLCELDLRNRNLAAAVARCRQSIRFQRAALAARPGDAGLRIALANRHGWLADALFERGHLTEALDNRRAEASIVAELLQASPANADLRDRVVWPEIGIGKIEIKQGRWREGVARLRRALADLDRLGAELPDNQAILGRRVRTNILIAQTMRIFGQGEWRTFRDAAAGLLASTGSAPGLLRYRKMLETLDKGGRK